MLEVKNLKRVYKVKGGSSVYALNDVSIKFPETGLVFILGKSGSGKSTLLNVMGGLDKADEGEIIINGKSSKSFSKTEMDSYRNTYLGFIFQEYNILNDFSVKENIALALELQHKKATDEAINDILKEVDLEGYGKRKPNELSGGQKQRVAIARALVKNPKIIFADEPTGALDSNTGKQVFETLKNLSKTRLVVVVSHDRDFAEHFGDRVIELKDGEIISDISKTSVTSEQASDGLTLLGDNIIRLSKDRPLKVEDLPIINEAIKKSEGEVYIVGDAHVNSALCEAAKINKEGNREEFIETDPTKVEMGSGTFEPIKSKFSLTHAFRMGAKSLRIKPFRLVMTILLSTVAFSLFGASLTLSMFNAKSAMKSTIQKTDISVLTITAHDKRNASGLNDDRIKELEETTGAKVFLVEKSTATLPVSTDTTSRNDFFHASRISSKLPMDESELASEFGFEITSGAFPATENECLLPLYAYWSFEDLGYGKGDVAIPADKITYSTIIGTTLSFTDGSSYKISGIVDTKLPASLAAYRTRINDINYSNELYYLSMGYDSNIHTSIITKKVEKAEEPEDYELTRIFLTNETGEEKEYYPLAYYPTHSSSNYFFKDGQTSLNSGEALMTLSKVRSLFKETKDPKEGSLAYAVKQIENNEETFKFSYIEEHYDELYAKCKGNSDFQSFEEIYKEEGLNDKEILQNFLTSNAVFGSAGTKQIVEDAWITEEKKYLDGVSSDLPLDPVTGTLPTGKSNNDNIEPLQTWTFKIVGIDFAESYWTLGDAVLSISETDMDLIKERLVTNNYVIDDSTKGRVGFLTYGKKESTLDKFLDLYFAKSKVFSDADYDISAIPDNAWYLRISNGTLQTVETYATLIVILTHVFLYIGIAMAIFSMLLFYNFMSISINNKKREIGILRAVGAKRSDVFKIFYSEAFIIAFINFILSTIVVFVVSHLVNASVIKGSGIIFNLMNPNFLVALALLGASLASSIISAFLPVTKIANKKPIDAIQNR